MCWHIASSKSSLPLKRYNKIPRDEQTFCKGLYLKRRILLCHSCGEYITFAACGCCYPLCTCTGRILKLYISELIQARSNTSWKMCLYIWLKGAMLLCFWLEMRCFMKCYAKSLDKYKRTITESESGFVSELFEISSHFSGNNWSNR